MGEWVLMFLEGREWKQDEEEKKKWNGYREEKVVAVLRRREEESCVSWLFLLKEKL